MKKSIIETYNCDIYEVFLVVANDNTTLKDLQKLYTYSDNSILDGALLDAVATTAVVKRLKDNRIGLLVKYNHPSQYKNINKKADFVNTCSHEATHVGLRIYEIIDQQVCFCTPEPFCYLQAWAAECIYKTLTKKR